jgi:MFS family permease
MMKIDMGIAIVCMVNQTALNLQKPATTTIFLNNTNHTAAPVDQCTVVNQASHSNATTEDGPFVWDKPTQGLILSAYYYGYIITQIPGSYLAYRFGAVNVLCLSMGLGSAMTMLLPLFAKWSYIALFVCLFFIGLCFGAFLPSASGVWAYWAPSTERARLIGMTKSGLRVGNIIGLTLGGVLCVHVSAPTICTIENRLFVLLKHIYIF